MAQPPPAEAVSFFAVVSSATALKGWNITALWAFAGVIFFSGPAQNVAAFAVSPLGRLPFDRLRAPSRVEGKVAPSRREARAGDRWLERSEPLVGD